MLLAQIVSNLYQVPGLLLEDAGNPVPASKRQKHSLANKTVKALRFVAGKLVTICGTVVRAGGIKPLVTHLDFLCPKCGCCFTEELQDGIFKTPTACRGDGCRAKYFVPQKGSARSIDWQKIRVQASINGDAIPIAQHRVGMFFECADIPCKGRPFQQISMNLSLTFQHLPKACLELLVLREPAKAYK